MPKLPVLSGRDVIRALARIGFEKVGQRGSHVKLRRGSRTVIDPNHREVRKGTLGSILQQADITISELLAGISH